VAGRSYSLTRRIVALVSIPVALSGLAIGALALYTSWHEIEEVYDAQLIHAAKVLRQLTLHELSEDGDDEIDLIPETEDLGYKYEQNIAFRIWRDGEPVTRSRNALSFGGLRAPPGLSSQTVAGENWRFFVYLDPASGVTVETSERYGIRYELVGYLLLGLLLPASLFVPVVLGLVWYGTGRGLRPLSLLSRDVDSRHSNDLNPIEPERTPREVESLINALNRLFDRLRQALDREREFTDNAAHEMRTPLAAIKTQAQALRRRLGGDRESSRSLANLLESIDRAADLVDKLLAFSRLQKDGGTQAPVDLHGIAAAVVAELAAEASARHQTLRLALGGPAIVQGDGTALEVMVRNLVENAVRYTPSGGADDVAVAADEARVVLQVSDNGPGIPDGEKLRVRDRFYRSAGSGVAGSGLGLAIVDWIAERHRAEMLLSDSDSGGLLCTVSFPEP